ncbi:hypothetical protein [Variovorax sp. 22077]
MRKPSNWLFDEVLRTVGQPQPSRVGALGAPYIAKTSLRGSSRRN